MQIISKDHIVRSPLSDIEIPECDVWTFLSDHFDKNGEKTAFYQDQGHEVETVTYSQVLHRTAAIADYLLKRGFKREIPVCIYMKNSIDNLLIMMAVWRIGGKVVCFNSMLTAGDIKNAIKELSSEYLFCDTSTVNNSMKSLSKSSTIEEVFIKSQHEHCTSLTSLYNDQTNYKLPKNNINPRTDVAVILYSSGTTGLPKGVEITHRGIVAQSRIVGGQEMDCLPRTYGIIYQPLSHIYGVCLFTMQVAYGITTIIMEKFDLQKYLWFVERFKIDQLYIVPPIAVAMSNSNLMQKFNLSHVRTVSSGAAPLSKEVEEKIKSLLHPGVQVKQSWGMTELVSMALTTPASEICHKLGLQVPQGSAGIPIPNVQMKVVDISTGCNLGPYKRGEVCTKADHFMKGYYKNIKATMETVDKYGWLHTGDVGYFNEDGFFFIVDKIKEVIKYKGYQVAPAELEAMLLTHPVIADAGVAGIPDISAGEIPHAWVVLKSGLKVSEQDLISYTNGKLAPYKWLRGGVRFVTKIPKTESGKILRRQIKEQSLENRRSIKSKM